METTTARPYFYGSSENRLNTKGQVAMPKRFRSVVPEEERERGYVLVRGEAECVYMYTHRQFGEIKDRARSYAVEQNDPEFFRYFMENAYPVDLDAQGRFVLPQPLRAEVGIDGPGVLFIGMDDRIELWAPRKRSTQRGDRDAYEQRREGQARRIYGL